MEHLDKLIELVIHPRDNIHKVFPYTKRYLNILLRRQLERLGFDYLSRPHPGQSELLKHVDFNDGFFVEVGANDGYFQDPTYYYEKLRGWRGILIEPLPLFAKCIQNRPGSVVFNYACVPDSYPEQTVTLIDSHAMSFVKGGIKNETEWIQEWEKISDRKHREIVVPARTLTQVLEEYDVERHLPPVDMLCIDVEGYELEVLKGLDVKKYAPKFIFLECHTADLLEEIKKQLNPFYQLLAPIPDHDFLFKRCG